MSDFEKLNEIKRNVKNIHCPIILLEMNRKVWEIERKLERVKNITVTIYNN